MHAAAANAARGISGIFITLNGNYMQWLQGPAENVQVLTAIIERDRRHGDFEVLLHRAAQHRLIQPWGGYKAERREATSSARDRLLSCSKAARAGSSLAPEDFIRAMCWPSMVPHVSINHRPINVVLFGATLMWTSAITTSASLQHGVTTGRTRFSDVASQRRTDTLVEYVDYSLSSNAPVRLMACEISSVHNNLAVSIFAGADILVFMIASLNNDYLRDLVVSAAALCKQRSSPPRIVFLLARRVSDAGDALCELARELGFAPEVILISTLADSREALAAIEDSLSVEIALSAMQDEKKEAASAAQPFPAEAPSANMSLLSDRAASAANKSEPVQLAASSSDSAATLPLESSWPNIQSGQLKIVTQNTKERPLFGKKKLPTPPPKAAASLPQPLPIESIAMATVTDTLNQILALDGAMACALVDYTSGMTLGTAGSGINLDVAAAGNTEVLRAKMKVANALGITGGIEDILITLNNQYHILRPLLTQQGLFLYVVIDRAKGNLAMARFKISEVEKALKV